MWFDYVFRYRENKCLFYVVIILLFELFEVVNKVIN